MHFSALPRDIFVEICAYLGDEVAFLLYAGDRLLTSKLRALQRLSVRIGKKGGFLSFKPLYSLLDYFISLNHLQISSSDSQQLWKEKLKPEKLPSSLTHLKLDFWNSANTYLSRASLYKALPNLTSLQLAQTIHESTQPRSNDDVSILELKESPPSLRHLRIQTGRSHFMHINDLFNLPTTLETFTFGGLLSMDCLNGPTDFRRFGHLTTLHLNLTAHSGGNSPFRIHLPPTITDLAMERCFNLDMKDFCWHRLLPQLRTLLWRCKAPAKWEWLLEFPYTLRSIAVNFPSTVYLPPSTLADIITTLTSRNDNFLAFGTCDRMVPARLTKFFCLESYTIPSAFEPLFGAPIRSTYLEKLNEAYINAKSSMDEVSIVNRTATCVERRFLLSPVPKAFSSLLTPSLVRSLSKTLQSLIVELECHLGDTLRQEDLKHFSGLRTLKILTSHSKISTNLLSNILPPSVTRVRADVLIINSPLSLPHLERLKITQSAVDISWMPTLPSTLKRLNVRLTRPIDIHRKMDRDALLSFPRGLRRLSLRLDDEIRRHGIACPPKDLGIDLNALSSKAYHIKRLTEESEALELLTRNLSLIRLNVPNYAPKRSPQMSIYEELPDTIHNWLSMRIPFYRLFKWEHVRSRSVSAPISDDFINPKLNALSRTELSVLSTTLSHDSQSAQQLLQEQYLARRDIYIERSVGENVRKRKQKIAAEASLHWYLLAAFHISNLIIYGLYWALTGENLINRLCSLFAGKYSFASSIAISSILSHHEAAFGVLATLYKDLNFISSIIIAPFALWRLFKEIPKRSFSFSLLAPRIIYPGGITPLSILAYVGLAWPYSTVPWIGPIVGEWLLIWSTTHLLNG